MARRKKTPSKMTKRRFLRVLYRRGRIYVPVLALLLLMMAFFLPLSPPGLAGYIGRTIEARTGLPVSIDGVRIRLSAGEVTLRGIRLNDRDGGRPFTVDEVYLSGDFGELIAGSGRWPAQVIVNNPSELQLLHHDGRVEPQGSLATLIAAIKSMEVDEPEVDDEPLAIVDRATPAITVRNLHAVLFSDDHRLTGTRLAIQQIQVPSRIGSSEQVDVSFNGIATAGLSEDFAGTIVYSPRDERVALDLRLDGIKRDVTVHGFGDVHMAARGITLNATAHQIAEGQWQIGLDQEFDRFEISEMRTGGERWVEQDLALRARGVWDLTQEQIQEATFSIGGTEIDLALGGALDLDDDRNGKARLQVRRFPAPLIALGQRLARDEGFTVSRDHDSRLHVDVSAEGPFARFGEMDIDGTVEIAGWAFQRTGWPDAITVHEARGEIADSIMEISELRLSSGTLDARGKMRVPVTVPEGDTRPGSIMLSLRGTPETAFDFLRAHDITPAVVTAATIPLTIDLHADFFMKRREGLLEPMLQPDSVGLRGNVAWGEGTLLMDIVSGAMEVQDGSMSFDETSATLNQLSVRLGDIALQLAGVVELAGRGDFASPAYNAQIGLSGPVQEIVQLLGTHVELPRELDTASGRIDISGNAQGIAAADQWPTYDMRVRLEDAGAAVAFQVNPMRFSEADAEIHLTNDLIEITELKTRMEEDTQAKVTAEVSRSGIRATIAADSSLETVQYMLPYELDEMVMAGLARAEGEIRLEINNALPEAPDVLMAWMGALSDPENYRIHVLDDSPIRLRINAELTPLEPVTLFHREFPHQVDNIRGVVRADELGFFLDSIPSRWGDAEDVIVSGRVTLGHIGPLNVSFEANAPELDLNEWLDGWGKREWAIGPNRQAKRDAAATRTAQRPPPTSPPAPRLLTTISGRITLGNTEFLTVRAQNVVGDLEYEAWVGAENKLRVDVEEATAYGGVFRSVATILFPDGALPHIRASVDAREIGVNGFLADLRKDEEQTVGKLTGRTTLDGLLGDYSTWFGEGEYLITESKFIGDQVLVLTSRTLRMGFEQTQATTTWQGTGYFRDETVFLPDVKITSNEFNLVSDGAIGFDGSLDFRISVEFLGNRIEWIPVVGRFAPLVNRFTDFLVSAKLEGTVYEPRVRVVPFSIDATGLPFGRTSPGGGQ